MGHGTRRQHRRSTQYVWQELAAAGVLWVPPHPCVHPHAPCTLAHADLRLAARWLFQHPNPQPAERPPLRTGWRGWPGGQAKPTGCGAASREGGSSTALGWDPGSVQAQPGKLRVGPSTSNSCPVLSLLGHWRLCLSWESRGAGGWVRPGGC